MSETSKPTYYEMHREEMMETSRRWYRNNMERKKEYNRNYRKGDKAYHELRMERQRQRRAKIKTMKDEIERLCATSPFLFH